MSRWAGMLSPSGHSGSADSAGITLQLAGMKLIVSGSGSQTSAGVNQVRTLLTQYHLADLVSHNLHMQASQPVHVYVAQTAQGYARELQTIGISKGQAQSLSEDTGGFTQGNTVIVALYQNQRIPDLANTLAHELTHAVLNQNVGRLPSWINEGLAVFNGMAGQSAVQDPVAYAGYARQMAESVLDAAADGDLVPLADDEAQVLSGNASYDLELQDWLAVAYLIRHHGYAAFTDYFRRLRFGVPSSAAFYATFGETPQQYNREFTAWLKSLTTSKDKGFTVTIETPSSYRGTLRILQHATRTWRVWTAEPGAQTLSVTPAGSLLGGSASVRLVADSDPPDASTVYISMKPSAVMTYGGKRVKEFGFDIDYHYGMYAFANAWVTLQDGQQVYLNNPSLFGVKLTRLAELPGSNPLTSLIMMRSSS
ncbi:MAG: hypothetical protein K6T30_00340 [Alicyclobacillus sp.]|nr:hypothetical protein [Alicyclobacillus sp.]